MKTLHQRFVCITAAYLCSQFIRYELYKHTRSNDPYGFWEVVIGMFIFASILSTFAIRRKWFYYQRF